MGVPTKVYGSVTKAFNEFDSLASLSRSGQATDTKVTKERPRSGDLVIGKAKAFTTRGRRKSHEMARDRTDARVIGERQKAVSRE